MGAHPSGKQSSILPCSCPLHLHVFQLLLQPGIGVELTEQLCGVVEVQRDERNKLGLVPFVPEHQPLGKLRQRQQLVGKTSVIMGRVTSCSQQCKQNFLAPQNKGLGLDASWEERSRAGHGTGSAARAQL